MFCKVNYSEQNSQSSRVEIRTVEYWGVPTLCHSPTDYYRKQSLFAEGIIFLPLDVIFEEAMTSIYGLCTYK